MIENHVSMSDGDTHPMSPNCKEEDLDEVEEKTIECEICEGRGMIPCFKTDDIRDVDFDDCMVCGGSGRRLEDDEDNY